MTITEAIQLAVENGWDFRTELEWPESMAVFPSEVAALAGPLRSQVLLSPLFWQALGRGLGWKKGQVIGGVEMAKGSGYWHKMHDFIDHLIEGKSIESYFELLA